MSKLEGRSDAAGLPLPVQCIELDGSAGSSVSVKERHGALARAMGLTLALVATGCIEVDGSVESAADGGESSADAGSTGGAVDQDVSLGRDADVEQDAGNDDGEAPAPECEPGEAGTDCEACEAGTYCAGGEATAVACESGSWDHDADPSTPCETQTDCVPGEYVGEPGDALHDRSCAVCVTGFSDSVNAASCGAWSACPAGEYVVTAGSATADRSCATCESGTYSSDENATSCSPWSDCDAGQFVAVAGTASADRVCAACEAGSFSSGNNATACAAWSDCSAGEYVSTAGTSTTDRQCSACSTGSYSATANASSCTPWTDCSAGEYVSAAGTSTGDRTCASCASETFSDTTNADSCTAWSECAPGLLEVVAPGATNDRVCTGTSCQHLLDSDPSLDSGVYTLVLDPGTADEYQFDAYCDMDRNGGGWTLVMQNNSGVASPTPAHADAISSVTTTGTFGDDLSQFDVLVGLDHWNKLGVEIRMEFGSTANDPSSQVLYDFALDPDTDYSIALSNKSIVLGTTGSALAPGGYHEGMGFSTYDHDVDGASITCSTYFGNVPFWYNSCWTESMWGYNASDSSRFGWASYGWGAYWIR